MDIAIPNYDNYWELCFQLVDKQYFLQKYDSSLIPLTNSSLASDLKTTLLIVDEFGLGLVIIVNLLRM